MTSSNGNILRATRPLCGNSPVTGEFPSQRPVRQSSDVFFDLRLNKWLSKQSRHWWFEMPSCSLWRHCNDQNLVQCNCHNLLCSVNTWHLDTRSGIILGLRSANERRNYFASLDSALSLELHVSFLYMYREIVQFIFNLTASSYAP